MTASLLEQLADLPKAEVDALIRAMAPDAAAAFEYHWRYRARPEQLPPVGSWRVWLLMAGRGFGKTRCGAEWVRAGVKAGRRRIALVAPTARFKFSEGLGHAGKPKFGELVEHRMKGRSRVGPCLRKCGLLQKCGTPEF